MTFGWCGCRWLAGQRDYGMFKEIVEPCCRNNELHCSCSRGARQQAPRLHNLVHEVDRPALHILAAPAQAGRHETSDRQLEKLSRVIDIVHIQQQVACLARPVCRPRRAWGRAGDVRDTEFGIQMQDNSGRVAGRVVEHRIPGTILELMNK